MPSPIASIGAVVPPQWQLEPEPLPFEAVLEKVMRRTAVEIEQREVTLDALVRDVKNGRQFSNAELLALQVKVHQYSLEVELLSKIVQQAVQGLRDLLRTQV